MFFSVCLSRIAGTGFLISCAGIFLFLPSIVPAHPMGNFTLNQTVVLELVGDKIVHHALVDFAEVPSFEQFSIIDADEDRIVPPTELNPYLDALVETIIPNYHLTVDGERIPFELKGYTPRMSQGVARVTCLQFILRLEATFPATADGKEFHYENRTYADRFGRCYVRLLWSPEYAVSDVGFVPDPGTGITRPVSDFEQSWFFVDTRDVRFTVKKTGNPVGEYRALPTQFSALDPYLPFDLVPKDVLLPDSEGNYHIFHIKLAQDVALVPPSSPVKPRQAVPIPKEDRAVASAPSSATQSVPDTSGASRRLGEAERKFSDLIHRENVGPTALLVMIGLSMMYGAAHALSPGHGKTIVAAYLVGTQGHLWRGLVQAVYLGIIVTLSHVFVVLAVGIIAMTLTAGVLTPKATVFLQIASGLMVIAIGIPMIVKRVRTYYLAKAMAEVSGASVIDMDRHAGETHPHVHAEGEDHGPVHSHEHGGSGHYHRHEISADASWWDLLVLGITGGMVPCLGAVIVFLIGAGYGKLALGVTLIISFSVGLAAVLIAVGISMVLCKQVLDRFFRWFDDRFKRKEGSARVFFRLGMPIMAAVLITLLGVAICIRALIQGGFLVINLG